MTISVTPALFKPEITSLYPEPTKSFVRDPYRLLTRPTAAPAIPPAAGMPPFPRRSVTAPASAAAPLFHQGLETT